MLLHCNCSCFVLRHLHVDFKSYGNSGAGQIKAATGAGICANLRSGFLRAVDGNHPSHARGWSSRARLCLGVDSKRRAGRTDLLGRTGTKLWRRRRALYGGAGAIFFSTQPPVVGAYADAKRCVMGKRASVDTSAGDRALHHRAIDEGFESYRHAPAVAGGGKARNALRIAAP